MTAERRGEHRPGRARAHRRRRAARRLAQGPATCSTRRSPPNGRVGATSPIQSGWTGHQDAALTRCPAACAPSGARSARPTATEPNRDLNTALSTDGGASWQLQPGSVVPRGAQAYGSDVSATTLPERHDAAGMGGDARHVGARRPRSRRRRTSNYQAPLGNYGNYPGIAADAGGRAMMAWFSSAAAHRGVLAQGVNADGSPAGAVMTMPGTHGDGRRRDGVAHADRRAGQERRLLRRLRARLPDRRTRCACGGSARGATLLDRTAANPQTALAADAKGRLWVGLERRHVR